MGSSDPRRSSKKAPLQTDFVEQVVTHARRIQRAGARMNRLIGDLVDVASIEAGALAVTREVGDPTTVVTEAVDTFQVQAATTGVSLAAEIVPPPSLAAFDAARILQVLTNLLSNAIKFTPAHGRIVVHVERIGDEIRFAVSDTGVGIATDKLEAVFVRFLQVAANDRRGVDSVSTSPKPLCKVTAAESGQKARLAKGAHSALRCRSTLPTNRRRTRRHPPAQTPRRRPLTAGRAGEHPAVLAEVPLRTV